MLYQKPTSRSRKKKIKSRIKHLQRKIDINALGTKYAFLTREETMEFRKKNNIRPNVFEYCTIFSIMELNGKYEEALDVLEKHNIPNVHTHRGFLMRTRQAFFDDWNNRADSGLSFFPNSSLYLIFYK